MHRRSVDMLASRLGMSGADLVSNLKQSISESKSKAGSVKGALDRGEMGAQKSMYEANARAEQSTSKVRREEHIRGQYQGKADQRQGEGRGDMMATCACLRPGEELPKNGAHASAFFELVLILPYCLSQVHDTSAKEVKTSRLGASSTAGAGNARGGARGDSAEISVFEGRDE